MAVPAMMAWATAWSWGRKWANCKGQERGFAEAILSLGAKMDKVTIEVVKDSIQARC